MKKVILFLSIIAIVVFSFPSCSSSGKSEVKFLNELIWCNTQTVGESFGFQVIYLYKGNKPKVEFVGFDDHNLDTLLEKTEELTDDPFDKEYNGYRAAAIGFYFDFWGLSPEKEIKINKMNFLVDNEKVTLDFDGRINLRIFSDNELYNCESVYSTNVPFIIFSHGKNIETTSFNYSTDKKVTIEKFEFSDYLNIENSQVYVNGVSVGAIDEAFPLNVEANSNIRIDFGISFGEYNSYSDFMTDAVLSYSGEEGTRLLKDFIVIKAVGNYDDLCKLIDEVIDKVDVIGE